MTAMLHSINAFFEKLFTASGEAALPVEDLQIATAALLIHAVTVDGMVTEAETARLQDLLKSHFQLGDDELQRLLDQAGLREREAVDIYRFTATLRDRLSPEDKRTIIEMMWRLVYADGELDPVEDNLVWRAAELLAVPARERMELKRMVRDEG
jgi:uncharacterized tellurite resistance protein B-like protein